MADKKMYKVGITVKEPWSADISYEVLDITLYAVENGGDGCSYIAIRANQGVTPGTDDTVWVKATQRGQSIYDLAVKYGDFEGTEAEFEAEYEAAVHAAQSAAQSASDIEAQVETNEAARVTAERARSDAETARSSAETARINAENARNDAESLRVTAESDRVRAEAGRVTAEASRVEAETFRQGAEQSRRQQFEGLKTDMETAIDNVDAKSAEIAEDIEGYEANEAARVSAESARAAAESARVSAEQSRVSAEQGRATAETARQTAEGNRATAETERASAEGTRTTAEQGRVSAESGRVSAESARVAAETARESASATAVQNAETATAAANTAAEHAEEAATTIDDKIAGKADESEVSQLRHEVTEKIDGQEANYLANMAVTQSNRTPVSAEGFGCSDFIPYTQGDSVYWKWGGGTNLKSLCFYDSDKQPITNGYWNGDAAGGQRTISASDINRYAPTAAYIRASFVLQYKDVATVITGDVVWTPVDAVPGLTPRVSALEQEVETQQGKIEAMEEVIGSLNIDKIYSGQDANYENGRIGAGGNIYKDSYSEGWYIPTDFIPCSPGDVLTWTSGENNGDGRKCLCLYDENKVFVPNGYWQPSQQPKTISITSEYSTARYVRFCFKLKKADTTDNTTPLLINGAVAFEVQNYIPGLTPTDEKATEALDKVNQLLPTDTEHGIIGENYPSEVLVVENQLQAKLANRFHFIHISDNHGASFGYAQQYLDYSPAKFLINTGDLVADKFADKDLESFQTITLATEPTKPVYLALGNHDYSHATSRQAVFDAFLAPTNTHNGTAFDKTYYSLDFSTEKVKCIVLDMNDGWADEDLPNYGPSGNLTWGKMSQTQINWLATQLQDAITNSLDVVIFIHTPPAQVSRFNRIKDFSDTINLDYARNLTFLPGLIDAFINGETASFTYDGNTYSFTFASGGHFVSWLCGHEHGDLCGWMDGHENQFVAVVCRPYRDTSEYSGSYDGDKLGVHWNYCTIDTGRKSFAVYRMGQQTTIFGTDRISFRILYK